MKQPHMRVCGVKIIEIDSANLYVVCIGNNDGGQSKAVKAEQ